MPYLHRKLCLLRKKMVVPAMPSLEKLLELETDEYGCIDISKYEQPGHTDALYSFNDFRVYARDNLFQKAGDADKMGKIHCVTITKKKSARAKMRSKVGSKDWFEYSCSAYYLENLISAIEILMQHNGQTPLTEPEFAGENLNRKRRASEEGYESSNFGGDSGDDSDNEVAAAAKGGDGGGEEVDEEEEDDEDEEEEEEEVGGEEEEHSDDGGSDSESVSEGDDGGMTSDEELELIMKNIQGEEAVSDDEVDLMEKGLRKKKRKVTVVENEERKKGKSDSNIRSALRSSSLRSSLKKNKEEEAKKRRKSG